MARPTVLIVEDEDLVLEIATIEFEDAGYQVETAQDADAALARIEAGTPIDLLFTDIRMPGRADGWEIARRARAVHPELPVIYTTGYSNQTPAAVKGALFFAKPYRMSEILSAVQRLI